MELNSLKRVIAPTIEKFVPSYYAVSKAWNQEFAGVIEIPVGEARKWFSNQPRVYANNLAALKYRETESGKVFESGSYAYRPDGYFGKWQLHFRLYETVGGRTALFVHWEVSPITRPWTHYAGTTWDSSKGINEAVKFFEGKELTLITGVKPQP